MKKFFYCLWRVILALLILFGVPLLFILVGMLILYAANPLLEYGFPPTPWSIWVYNLTVLLGAMFQIALVVWVVIDATKFKKRGIKTSPLLWAIGMIFLTVIVFPVYLVYRKITWPDKLLQAKGK